MTSEQELQELLYYYKLDILSKNEEHAQRGYDAIIKFFDNTRPQEEAKMSELEIKMYADRSQKPSAQCQNIFINFYSQNFQKLGATIYIESNKEGTELNFMINGKLVCTLVEEST